MNSEIADITKNYSLANIDILEGQGLCNTTYLLNTSKNQYIIKKFDKSIHSNANRKSEFRIQLLAYKKNIASKPILLDSKNQIMFSSYKKGYHKSFLCKSDLQHIAKAMIKLHNINLYGKTFDIKKYIEENSKKIDIKSKLALLKLKRFKQNFVLCHNDLNPKNILFGNKICFIDWEFASINDKYFDLASIIIEFKLSKRDEDFFLRSYFKTVNANRKKLGAYKILYKHICKIWFDTICKVNS